MSVGLQRLREDAGRDPQGRDRQGRGPGDRRSRARGSTRAAATLLGDGDALKAERNAASKQIGEAIKGGAKPDGPEVAALKRRARSRPASEIERDRRGARGRSRPRSRSSSSASRTRPTPTCRSAARRRTSPSGPGASSSRASSRSTARSARTRPTAARRGDAGRTGRSASALDIIDNSARRQDRRLGLPGLQGRRLGAPAGADQLLPRRPHPRERHDRGLAAGRRQHRLRHGHRPDPRQGRPDVRRHPRRPLPGPDRRGPGHEPPPRRDPRGGRAADPLRRLLAVLPARGRRGRQGHPRHPPRPPVRQGRDGLLREAGRLGGGARVADRARRDPAPAARAGLPRAAHGDRRHGLRPGEEVRPRGLGAGRRALARGQLVLELPRLPGAPDGDPLPARSRARSRSSSTRSTARASRSPAIVAAILETYQQPDGSVRVPDVLQPYVRSETL